MEQKVTEIGVFEYTESVHGGYWETKKNIKLFSKVYEINLRIDVFEDGPEGFTDEMVMATKACLDTINQTDKVEQAIKNFYNTDIRYTLDEQIEIEDINEFVRLVKPIELYVTDFKIGLYNECDWDDEDGLGIKFDREGNIKDVGGAGGTVY